MSSKEAAFSPMERQPGWLISTWLYSDEIKPINLSADFSYANECVTVSFSSFFPHRSNH